MANDTVASSVAGIVDRLSENKYPCDGVSPYRSSVMSPAELKERLRVLGFSPKAFAQRVGTHERTVRRWCNGEQEVPSWVRVMLDLMKEAHDRGHGEFYAAWNNAFNKIVDAFDAWIKEEAPSYGDIAIELGQLLSDLCKKGKISPRDLHLED